MGLETQGAKPTGLQGRLMGKLMNKYHTILYKKYFENNLPGNNSRILDIGCGGGKFIQYLSKSNGNYKLFGMDHSSEMVKLSEKLNRKRIENGIIKIFQGTVLDIPVEDENIDLATAFETVQFWPNINEAFSEVFRILKNGGEFLIINRYPKEETKWWKLAKLKSKLDYMDALNLAGFVKTDIDLEFRKDWIIVKATK